MAKEKKKEESKVFNTKKVLSLVVVFLSTFAITASFASLSYSIQSRPVYYAPAAKDQYDVKLANMNAAQTTGNPVVLTAAKLNDTGIGVFEVQFAKPGDAVKYSFEIQNKGTVDAKIVAITKGNPTCTAYAENDTRMEEVRNADATLVCGNLEYTITYEDGKVVAKDDVIAANSSKKVNLTIKYKDNSQSATDSVKVTVPSVTIRFEK